MEEGTIINQEEFLKRQKIEMEKMKELEALNFLKYSSPLRQTLIKIVESEIFEWVMIVIIFANTVELALDNPLNDPNSRLVQVITTLDYIFSAIFILEAIGKILAFGLINCGSKSYLR